MYDDKQQTNRLNSRTDSENHHLGQTFLSHWMGLIVPSKSQVHFTANGGLTSSTELASGKRLEFAFKLGKLCGSMVANHAVSGPT
jgi:hypothetical protein